MKIRNIGLLVLLIFLSACQFPNKKAKPTDEEITSALRRAEAAKEKEVKENVAQEKIAQERIANERIAKERVANERTETIEKEELESNRLKPSQERKVIGHWVDGIKVENSKVISAWPYSNLRNEPGRGSTVIYSENGKFYMTRNSEDGTSNTFEIVQVEHSLRIEFVPVNPPRNHTFNLCIGKESSDGWLHTYYNGERIAADYNIDIERYPPKIPNPPNYIRCP